MFPISKLVLPTLFSLKKHAFKTFIVMEVCRISFNAVQYSSLFLFVN